MPEKSWRLRPYLGYDWIAGAAHSMHTPGPGVGSGSPGWPAPLPEPAPPCYSVSTGPPSLLSTFCTCLLCLRLAQ